MPTRQIDRQYPRVAAISVNVSNIGAGNEVTASLPIGAFVHGIDVIVPTAFDGTTVSLTVSDGTTTFVNARDAKAANLYSNVVLNGLLSPTSANLTSILSAGEAFVGNVYVSTGPISFTYAASSDTYDDLNPNGTITRAVVANGGAVPAVTAGALRLQKVVTSAAAVTAVTRLATLAQASVVAEKAYPSGGTVTVSLAQTGTSTVGRAFVLVRYAQVGHSKELCE